MKELFKKMDEFEAFRNWARGGSGDGLAGLLQDPEVMARAIELFGTIMAGGHQAAGDQEAGLASVAEPTDDAVKRLAEDEHRQLQDGSPAEGIGEINPEDTEQVAPPPASPEDPPQSPSLIEPARVFLDESPRPGRVPADAPCGSPETVDNVPDGPTEGGEECISVFLESIDPDELAALLKLAPTQVVNQLKDQRDEGQAQARLLWAYLADQSIEGLILEISKYSDHSVLGNLARDLQSEERLEWLTAVLDCVQETDRNARQQDEGVEVQPNGDQDSGRDTV